MKDIKVLLILVATTLVLACSWIAFYAYQNKLSLNPTNSYQTSFLDTLKSQTPNVQWSNPSKTSMQTQYGNLQGTLYKGTTTAENPMLTHFEDSKMLQKEGFSPDIMLQADGPGSSMWGYKKTLNGKTEIITFSYNTTPTSTRPDQPLEFSCPCKMTVEVFISDPFNEKQ